MNESLGIISHAKYEKAWSEFYNYANVAHIFNAQPQKSVVIWKEIAGSLSPLNHFVKIIWKWLCTKESKHFTKDEINSFLTSAPDSGEFIHIKAGIVLGFCGGLRCAYRLQSVRKSILPCLKSRNRHKPYGKVLFFRSPKFHENWNIYVDIEKINLISSHSIDCIHLLYFNL